MRHAIIFAPLLFALGCSAPSSAPSSAPASGSSSAPSSAPASGSSSAPSSAPASGSSAAPDLLPDPRCEARGLPWVNPCPEGRDPGDVLEIPEAIAFCCAPGSGPVDGAEEQGCFVAWEAARGCRSAAGERAVKARIDEVARKFGEPCKDPDFRRVAKSAFQGFERLCVVRGYP